MSYPSYGSDFAMEFLGFNDQVYSTDVCKQSIAYCPLFTAHLDVCPVITHTNLWRKILTSTMTAQFTALFDVLQATTDVIVCNTLKFNSLHV